MPFDDGAVVKRNADGSFAWVRQMSGPGVTESNGEVEDSVGNVYVSGSFADSVTLSTGQTLTNAGNGTFLMKLAFAPVPATKFYVVDDASANRTYEYDAAGGAIENYSLSDSAPRGAATTAVGDKVWVIDANRKVFVYDTSGGLLGSWTAGSMSSRATPEGIATNSTDVWIVDSKSDKVYKYAGAASRLSGSQNAASSFSLNSGNRSAKDIVTDGASLWVVNDSSTDKVFKYTVSGSLVGSWTIGSANSKPTGITIDPANVSDIWIVDSGTDLVYQYVGAASRTSGSQTAAATFALAVGNGNPQGIADPPPVGALRQDNTQAPSSSLARAAAISSAVGADFAFLGRSADKAPTSKTAGVLGRQQVFEKFAPQPNYLPAWRAPRREATASELEMPGFSATADDGQAVMDLALELAFANVS